MAAAASRSGFGRITDDARGRRGSVTSSRKFDHPDGKLIPHGDPADPTRIRPMRHVAPTFPLDAVDKNIVSRHGAIGLAGRIDATYGWN